MCVCCVYVCMRVCFFVLCVCCLCMCVCVSACMLLRRLCMLPVCVVNVYIEALLCVVVCICCVLRVSVLCIIYTCYSGPGLVCGWIKTCGKVAQSPAHRSQAVCLSHPMAERTSSVLRWRPGDSVRFISLCCIVCAIFACVVICFVS